MTTTYTVTTNEGECVERGLTAEEAAIKRLTADGSEFRVSHLVRDEKYNVSFNDTQGAVASLLVPAPADLLFRLEIRNFTTGMKWRSISANRYTSEMDTIHAYADGDDAETAWQKMIPTVLEADWDDSAVYTDVEYQAILDELVENDDE